MPDFISLTNYAKTRGVAVPSVSIAIQEGRIPEEAIQRHESGRVRGINPELADLHWRKTTAVANAPAMLAQPKVEEGDEGPDYYAARARKELAAATMAEIELDRMRGTLVERAKVEKAAMATARVIRDAVMSIPDRMASRLAAESDQTVIYKELERELREALNGLADRTPVEVLGRA